MIVKLGANGTSFKGAFAYYGHDKNANTNERVAFTESVNLRTNDPDQAWRIMMNTALSQDRLKVAANVKATGRKLETTVMTFVISWAIDQDPSKEEMIERGLECLKAIGAEDRQVMMFAHTDEPQKHLHFVINRVHPETGIALDPSYSKMQLSKWAEKYELEQGKIYCERRVENNKKRAQGEYVKYCEPVIETAWKQSDNGRSFAAALKRGGHILARGDRRGFVVVDPQGKVINPARHIRDAKAKDIAARLADLDLEKLPSVEEAKKQQAEQSKIRDAQQRQEAAQARAEEKRIEAFKHHTEKEVSKAFDAAVHGAADAERRRIENLYFELNLKHIEQQKIHQKQARLARTRAEDEIEETYRFKEKTEEIKATQARLNTKATFWGKITGKHEREKAAAEKELKDLRRAYAENLQKAEQNRQRVENLIRQDADNMAEAQKRDRDELPPKMLEREPSRSHAQEQDNTPQRSREVKQARGYDPP